MARDFNATRGAHPRAFEPWEAVDEAIIRAMLATSTGIIEMAARLSRTEGEIEAYLERTDRRRSLNGRRTV